MKSNLKNTIWLIVLNMLIVVGFGHGIACVGLLDIYLLVNLRNIFTSNIGDNPFLLMILTSLVGTVILILSVFIKKRSKYVLQITGATLYMIGYISIVIPYFFPALIKVSEEDSLMPSFYTGLPFLVFSIFYFRGIFIKRKRIIR